MLLVTFLGWLYDYPNSGVINRGWKGHPKSAMERAPFLANCAFSENTPWKPQWHVFLDHPENSKYWAMTSPRTWRWPETNTAILTTYHISNSTGTWPTWMSRWKLGSMVSKWVISPTYKWGIYWVYNPLILTLDPNFQQDIWVGTSVKVTLLKVSEPLMTLFALRPGEVWKGGRDWHPLTGGGCCLWPRAPGGGSWGKLGVPGAVF